MWRWAGRGAPDPPSMAPEADATVSWPSMKPRRIFSATACLLVGSLAAVGCQSKPDSAAAPAPTPEPASAQAQAPQTASAEPHGAKAEGASKAKPARVATDIVGADGRARVDELSLALPTGWSAVVPASSMRKAQFHVADGPPALDVIVFRFPGGGGSVQANIDRWKSQFTPPEGKSIDEVSQVHKAMLGPLTVTKVEIHGKFSDGMRPMAAAGQAAAGTSRMLGAIVEGSGNPYFFKFVGPDAAVAAQRKAFDDMLASMKLEAADKAAKAPKSPH